MLRLKLESLLGRLKKKVKKMKGINSSTNWMERMMDIIISTCRSIKYTGWLWISAAENLDRLEI